MNYCKIKSTLIVKCHGITKFPDNGNYAIVLNYLDGNLRDYLQKNHLTLKDRIIIFYYLCRALNDIHGKDLIDDSPMNRRNADQFIIKIRGKFHIKRSTKKIKKS